MQADNPLDTPVLLLTFNRPDATGQVLEALRAARPTRLFVASHGPRPHVPTDDGRVAATRALIHETVDWPSQVEYRYSDVTQGCRIGVSSAISWFFEHVEEGIILEDDCVPHPDFFGYCTELLQRYRDDERVMNIAGDNSGRLVLSDTAASYGFARQPLIWGWATWRRAWIHYDTNLAGWERLREDSVRQQELWPDRVERRWQKRTLDRLLLYNEPDSWAYRWSFTVADRQGLSVIPAVNLIRNIGFGPDATHTSARTNSRANVATQPILPLTHPSEIQRDEGVERQIFNRIHGGASLRNPAKRVLSTGKRVAKRVMMTAGILPLARGRG